MIRREIVVFLVVGSLTVLVDFLLYRCLVWAAMMGIDIAKATSFLAGTTFAYFANRFWTFGHGIHVPGSAWRFGLVYAATLGTNVLVNALALKLFAGGVASIQMAFLLATAVSASLNFLGMKLFVFKARAVSRLP
jgi:putative flippase GtrA